MITCCSSMYMLYCNLIYITTKCECTNGLKTSDIFQLGLFQIILLTNKQTFKQTEIIKKFPHVLVQFSKIHESNLMKRCKTTLSIVKYALLIFIRRLDNYVITHLLIITISLQYHSYTRLDLYGSRIFTGGETGQYACRHPKFCI